MKKLIATTAAVALLAVTAGAPTQAEARTKTILKYGAIGLGAAALSQAMQPSYGYYGGYYPSSSYSYGYSQPSYGGYYDYGYSSPSYGGYYNSGYSYPSYGYNYGYSPGYSSGYYYY